RRPQRRSGDAAGRGGAQRQLSARCSSHADDWADQLWPWARDHADRGRCVIRRCRGHFPRRCAGALLLALRLAQFVYSAAFAVFGARGCQDLARAGRGAAAAMNDAAVQQPAPLLADLQNRPYSFSLFAALRLIERACAQQPRLGESRKASDDVVRLAQAPHLSFAPSDVASATTNEEGQFHLEQYGFGVLGPNGALPLHLTELAYERRRQKEDGTIADFLNLFQHRLISLFYRA